MLIFFNYEFQMPNRHICENNSPSTNLRKNKIKWCYYSLKFMKIFNTHIQVYVCT